MGNKTLLPIILSLIGVTIISGIVFTTISLAGNSTSSNGDTAQASSITSALNELGDHENNNGDYTYIPPTLEKDNNSEQENIELLDINEETEIPFIPATEMDLDPNTITLFVNKEFALSKDFKPEVLVVPDVLFDLQYYDERTLMRPEAAEALESLFLAAKEEGLILYGVSGYRSYQRQYKIFTNNIVNKGKIHTLRYSAVPGTSEHQTGLAIDVSTQALDFKLSTSFATSNEGIWLAENAHRFGYIIRYMKGKSEITGYAYEPWHIRYVGKGLANYLYINELTLDEYYNYKPSANFDFETLYADMINYTLPEVSIIPLEGVEPILDENGNIIEGELTEGSDVPVEIPDDTVDIEPTDDPIIDDPDGNPETPPEDDEAGVDPLPEDEQDENDSGEGEDDTDIPDDDNIDSATPTPPTPTPLTDGTTDNSEEFNVDGPTPMVDNNSATNSR